MKITKFVSLLIIASILSLATSQEAAAAATANIATNTEAAQPSPAKRNYTQQLSKIRQQLADNPNADKDQIRKRILNLVDSMSPEQKTVFQSKLAGESRQAYDKFMKQRQIKQAQQQKEIEALKQEVVLTEGQQILQAEKDEIIAMEKRADLRRKNYTDYMFELTPDVAQDFRFTLAIDQDVSMFFRSFSNQDGVFNPVSDVENQPPITVYVYENRDKFVVQASFYSLKLVDFKGKGGSSYLIRFQTPASHRLIFFHLTNLVLDSHVNSKLVAEDIANHAVRVTDLRDEIIQRMQRVKETIMMDKVNQEGLNKGLDHYYFYNIAEIVVLGLICVIQVESVRKLLLSSSVV